MEIATHRTHSAPRLSRTCGSYLWSVDSKRKAAMTDYLCGMKWDADERSTMTNVHPEDA